MKKFYWVLIAALTFCLVLSACADKKDPEGGTSAPTKSAAATQAATKAPAGSPTAAPTAKETIPVSVTVDDLLYTYVVNVKYKEDVHTWNKLLLSSDPGLDIDNMEITFEVPNDGSEIELTAVVQENAPYKVKGWSGDATGTGETIKFKPSGNSANLKIDVEPLYGENLALDAAVTVSTTTEENTAARWGKDFLTDGDINTRMSTTTLTGVDEETLALGTPITVDVNLGEAKNFDMVSLFPRTDTVDQEDGVPNYPFEFEILVSKDGTTYTSAKKVSLEENVTNMMQTYDVGAQNAQYIRISITKVGNMAADEGTAAVPYRVQFAELMVFDKP